MMGHSIQFYSVEVSKGQKGKDNIEMIALAYAISQGDYNSPLNSKIRWIDSVYENANDAREGIRKHDNGWYDQLAVKYKDYGVVKDTKVIQDLKERLSSYKEDLKAYKTKNSVSNRKSKFIGCDECGSKINKEYVSSQPEMRHWNLCPLCNNDLSSTTVKESIVKKKERIALTTSKVNEMIKRNEEKGKYKLMWLVKTEFHV